MLSRRALIVSTAALATACGPFGSSSSLPSLPQPTALTWHMMPHVHRFRVDRNMQEPRDVLSQIAAALEEDTENPSGPARGRYTLMGHALDFPEPYPESHDEFAAWIGGLETDIVAVEPWMARGLGELGVFLPLERFIAADEPVLTESFYPFVLEQFRGNGGLYALPVSAEPLMLDYDARYFAQQGVPPVDETWDWDDLVAHAVKLTRRYDDGTVMRWGLMSHMYGIWWALLQNEAEMFDLTTGQCRLHEPAAVEALRFCHDLLHTHRVSPPVGAIEFLQKHFPPSRTWAAMSYVPYQSLWFPGYRWAELPRGKVRSVPVTAGMALAITAQTRNTEAAYTALKGLLHTMQRFVHVSAQRDAVARLGEIHPNLPPEEAAALQRSMEHGHALPYNSIGPTMYDMIDSLARGANVATVVNEACSEIESWQ